MFSHCNLIAGANILKVLNVNNFILIWWKYWKGNWLTILTHAKHLKAICYVTNKDKRKQMRAIPGRPPLPLFVWKA